MFSAADSILPFALQVLICFLTGEISLFLVILVTGTVL